MSIIAKFGRGYNLVAVFEVLNRITLVYDSSLGTASYTRGTDGNEVTLTAQPNSNAQFLGWYINSQRISDSLTTTYLLLGDTTVEARFEKIYSVNLTTSGNGSASYSRNSTDRNTITVSALPNTLNHFVKYDVNGVEYFGTPLTIRLREDSNIVAYFAEDERIHVNVTTNIPYASVYISHNDDYAGFTTTLWARPFPDYYFVRWQDGNTENPRQVTITNELHSFVAEYQRVTDTNGIYQYRCFIKDQLNMTSAPKAFLRVDTFSVRTDLMTNATSSVTTIETPTNVNEGDVLVLYDPKGQFLYNGVITSIEDNTIGLSQMQSFYQGKWIYSTSPQDYLEHEIAVVLKDYADGKLKGSTYIDGLVSRRLGGITIDYVGSTTVNLPSTYESDEDGKPEVIEMEEFIYSLYEKYGIVFDFEINVAGANYVHIKIPTFARMSVGNNMFAIQNMLPITEIEETNRLVIYSAENVYRTTYVALKTGIVENPTSLVNRFNITNTEIVFSDDPVADLVAANLPSQMYNHKLEFDLIIKNYIYEFGDFNLGGVLDIYYGDEYYDSVLTGYEISKSSNQNITDAHFICGKVRTSLTKLITLGRL